MASSGQKPRCTGNGRDGIREILPGGGSGVAQLEQQPRMAATIAPNGGDQAATFRDQDLETQDLETGHGGEGPDGVS